MFSMAVFTAFFTAFIDACFNAESADFFRDSKKKMLYEGVSITKISEFVGRFRAVFFTPDHLSLVKGSPDERRRFADMALAQIKPSYIRCLNEYMRLLSQRNAMLRNAKLTGKCDEALLSVYSEALADSAAVITRQRAFFSEYLEGEAARFYESISGRNEKLFIRYLSNEKEELLLQDKSYQQQMCYAIFCGILRYFKRL